MSRLRKIGVILGEAGRRLLPVYGYIALVALILGRDLTPPIVLVTWLSGSLFVGVLIRLGFLEVQVDDGTEVGLTTRLFVVVAWFIYWPEFSRAEVED